MCSHRWIDPEDPPIERLPYSPVIGDGRRQMKYNHVYVCQNCGARIKTLAKEHWEDRE